MITLYRPNKLHPWLTHQVGVTVQRPETEPVFCGREMRGTQRTGRTVTVFHLLGWGETTEAAERMAKGETK
jgi:hypothetical protein